MPGSYRKQARCRWEKRYSLYSTVNDNLKTRPTHEGAESNMSKVLWSLKKEVSGENVPNKALAGLTKKKGKGNNKIFQKTYTQWKRS